MTRILIDQAIPGGTEAFAPFGEVAAFDGRQLMPAAVADADALIVRSVTRVDAALLANSRVRFVGSVTSGTDHIDQAWLAQNGITFADAAGCNSVPVAEYVVGSLLALTRRRGTTLAGKRMGVVGVGRIGSIVADWAASMGMPVVICDPPVARAQNRTVGYVQLETLLQWADFVSLHVPLTFDGPDATADLIGAAELAAMRPGAVMINTSRGEVVDESALKRALQSGHLGGAVIDVWRNEPDIDIDLIRLAAIATPHIAGYSQEAKSRAVQMIRETLAKHLGVEPGMFASDPLQANEKVSITLDAPTSDARIRQAVAAGIDVEAIDCRMREWADRDRDPDGFESMRRELLGRREFGSIVPNGSSSIELSDSEESSLLGRIGFHINP